MMLSYLLRPVHASDQAMFGPMLIIKYTLQLQLLTIAVITVSEWMYRYDYHQTTNTAASSHT